jgi:6-phosphogluconolactonase (cycloisomerase 2 family)
MRARLLESLVALAVLAGGHVAVGAPFLLLVQQQVFDDGVDGIETLAHVNGLAFSPDGEHLYAAAAGDAAVNVFARHSASGALVFVEAARDGVNGVDGLAGASAVVVSGDGAHVYVTGQTDDAVAVFTRNAATGSLGFVTVYRDGEGGITGLGGPTRIVLSPDGAYVYVAGLGGTIAVFARNATSGRLTPIQTVTQDVVVIGVGSGLTISPDGAHLYLGGAALTAFARNAVTGVLSPLGVQADVGSVVAVSPDGSLVYSSARDGLAVFARDPTTGVLTKVHQFRRLLGRLIRDRFYDATISADGEYFYALSGGGYVAVLRRDPATGDVSLRDVRHVQVYNATAIAVDPSGARLAVTGPLFRNRVAVFGFERRACDPAPRASCVPLPTGGVSTLVLKSPPASQTNAAVWTWARGADIPVAAFGDPLRTTHHAFCVYDASAASQPVLDAVVPPGGACNGRGCWDVFPEYQNIESYRYRDKSRRDGLVAMQLRSGTDRRAKLKLKGNGPTLAAPPVALTLPVRAQLQNDASGCWEASYTTADSNGGGLFRATAH